jgi:hypothetical protein
MTNLPPQVEQYTQKVDAFMTKYPKLTMKGTPGSVRVEILTGSTVPWTSRKECVDRWMHGAVVLYARCFSYVLCDV